MINVIFDAASGRCAVQSREARTGEPLTALPEAVRDGYAFEGWSTQRGGKGTLVQEGSVLDGSEDVTLYAHFVRQRGAAKKRSSYRKQRRALWGLLGAVVGLVVLLLVVNALVSVFPYVDAADGAKYYARKTDGVYAIYDAQGALVPTNESGYYLTASGTQLQLDKQSGQITEYAVVDVEGLEVEGATRRIMMFPQITQSNVARIEVSGPQGSYAFYTDKNGNVQIEGFEAGEGRLISYDAEKYAALCVAAGYPLTLRKLSAEAVQTLGYEAYGLAPETRVDEQGNEYSYRPTSYTITSKAGVSHTVLVGDPIVSEAGYYVKLAGEDNRAVYIMSATNYDGALLLPIEQLITPMINYPASNTNYFDVLDFVLARPADDAEGSSDILLAFDYIDLEERENSMYTTTPYIPDESYQYKDYRLNSTAVSSVLEALSGVNFVGVRKLGLSEEVLAEYGLDQPAYLLSYTLMVDTDEDSYTDTPVPNALLISELTEQGTYLVASPMCDVVAEVTRASLFFLEHEASDWISDQVVWFNLAFLRSMSVTSPEYSAELTFDNSKTDQSSSISSSNITFTINGQTPDYVVYKTAASSGKVTTETPVYNLRQFYKGLLSLSLGGSTEQGHFTLDEQQRAELRALDDSECQLVLRLSIEDMAATYNPDYYSENNSTELTYRFYRYSEGRSYLTINGEGEFFVDASYVEKLIADLGRLEQGVLIDSQSKT